MSILYIVWVLFYFIGSVLVIDLNKICNETNGSSHIKPGIVVSLLCYVNNTGDRDTGGNILIWNTPVSKI